MQKEVKIIEVCPRDGLQNLDKYIPLESKVSLVKQIIDAGSKEIELTSFVNPKWVPQFKDAAELVKTTLPYAEKNNTLLTALVPNLKGALLAREAGIKVINLVVSASEVHNMKNVNRSIEESMEGLKKIVSEVSDVEIRLAVACVFGSPFGDEVPVDRILHICNQAQSFGINNFILGDSAGISTPENTRNVLGRLKAFNDINKMGIHLHDTRGMGIANAYVAYEEGVRKFDTSLGALGGCPFIPGAKGNIATEDLVNMFHGMGIVTGYDLKALINTAKSLTGITGARIMSSMTGCS